MELAQYPDRLEIQNKNMYKFIMPIVGFFAGLLLLILWLLSQLSSTDILRVDTLTGVIGVFLMFSCGVMAYAADERTTVLMRDGLSSVITKRRISGKQLMQTFLASDVVKIEFVHGFTKESWGNVNRSSSIYVVLKNTDKIEVLMRYAIRPVSIPIKHNQPPIDEANIISGFLKVPLETVDIVSLDNGIKNFGKAISPPQYDRTRVILQAPTQEELDKKE